MSAPTPPPPPKLAKKMPSKSPGKAPAPKGPSSPGGGKAPPAKAVAKKGSPAPGGTSSPKAPSAGGPPPGPRAKVPSPSAGKGRKSPSPSAAKGKAPVPPTAKAPIAPAGKTPAATAKKIPPSQKVPPAAPGAGAGKAPVPKSSTASTGSAGTPPLSDASAPQEERAVEAEDVHVVDTDTQGEQPQPPAEEPMPTEPEVDTGRALDSTEAHGGNGGTPTPQAEETAPSSSPGTPPPTGSDSGSDVARRPASSRTPPVASSNISNSVEASRPQQPMAVDTESAGSAPKEETSAKATLKLVDPEAYLNNLRKLEQLEYRLEQSELYAKSLQTECGRLRETLYEREGVKVVQHIVELERENSRLRQQLQKERNTSTNRQGVHMATMDELVELKQAAHVHGDCERLETENRRLQGDIQRLIKENTTFSLRLADMTEASQLANVVVDPTGRSLGGGGQQLEGGGPSTYVRVRRGALCQRCIEMVDRMESMLAQRQALQASAPTTEGQYEHQRRHDLAAGAGTSSPGYSYHGDPMMASGTVSAPQPPEGARGWRTLRLPNGNTVYHNIITNKSQWEVPLELQASAAPSNPSPLPHSHSDPGAGFTTPPRGFSSALGQGHGQGQGHGLQAGGEGHLSSGRRYVHPLNYT